ncbi:MAG: ABC transporter ATP-binding protein [Candidatus Tectomicrobia bacterium]|uniref:ABC transporter ATP-binding protein n=1 Tax=Tectimicrobiota bacterium TaxID=2528274 RepID=A0A937W328_UNCTE|nr:ABC transporter ATP-binding protein [Candidatus Tectomicrobia bacterium]
MATVTLENISKYFGAVPAVQELSCHIAQGEFLALLGPSGCGKTTTLLMLAGIYRPSSGALRFDGRLVNDMPPRQRNIGMVFQSYALYPHLTVYENLAFPLRLKRASRSVIQHSVEQIASLVQLHDFLQRKPAQLSGGQQQRVALGRALIKEPDLLLFDEPLSNLDAELRLQMRAEIKRLQRALGITAVLVTHDQIEALSMADRILVLRDGRLQQLAEPQSLYQQPANEFVARFIGSTPMNFVPVEPSGLPAQLQLVDTPYTLTLPETTWAVLRQAPSLGVRYTLGLRPEDIPLSIDPAPQRVPATLNWLEPLGREVLLSVTCGSYRLKVLVPAPSALQPEMPVWLDLSHGPHYLFDPTSGLALG